MSLLDWLLGGFMFTFGVAAAIGWLLLALLIVAAIRDRLP